MEDPVDGAEAFMDIGQRPPHGLAVASVRDERQHVGAVRTQALDRRKAVRIVRRTVARRDQGRRERRASAASGR